MKISNFLKSITALCLCLALAAVFSGVSFAESAEKEPLPNEEGTTLGDVQEHFSPEVYEEMPQDLKEEAEKVDMNEAVKKDFSVGKIFGGLALLSLVFLSVAFYSDKPGQKAKAKNKKKHK